MQGDRPFEPKAFYQVNLDALVSQDNYYRGLTRELDLRWVRARTKKYYGREGQKAGSPIGPMIWTTARARKVMSAILPTFLFPHKTCISAMRNNTPIKNPGHLNPEYRLEFTNVVKLPLLIPC